MKTPNRSEYDYTPAEIARFIFDGRVAVLLTRVARSGMTRYMKFYVPFDTGFINITSHIAALLGTTLNKDGELKVGGCGMDMCFNTLYNALYGYLKLYPEDESMHPRDWDQKYNTL